MKYSSMNTDKPLTVRMIMQNNYKSSGMFYEITSFLIFIIVVLFFVCIGLVQKDRHLRKVIRRLEKKVES